MVNFKNQVIEESMVWGNVFNLVNSGMMHYCLPRVINFPEFIKCCVVHYSESQNVVMSHDRTQVLCHVNSQAICETLGITMDVS